MVYGFKCETQVMFWLPIFLLLMGTRGNSAKVQFYGKDNYEGFIEEYDLSGDEGGRCRSFVSNLLDIKSLKTDACIMLYGNLGCDIHYRHSGHLFQKSDSSYSLRVDADTPQITATLNAGGTQIVHSFGPCSRERGGGPEVDVDFYSDRNYQGEMLDSFRDVCGCQNLTKAAVGGKSKQISVDNHGHDIDLFEGKDCTGQKRSVRAGSNWATKWFWPGNDGMAVFDVQSFRPTHVESCKKLNAVTYKVHGKNYQGAVLKSAERIELYENENFQTLVREFQLTEASKNGCHRFDNEGIPITVKSVKTDGCLMLYEKNNCNQRPGFMEASIRLDADSPALWAIDILETKYSSFSVCSRKLGGGPEVDVDFYSEYGYHGRISASFLDVCGCQNLETSLWKKDISVDNHGNSIEIFEGDHCTGQTMMLRAGISYESTYMMDRGSFDYFFEVHSFRPTNIEDCMEYRQ